jgi:hypothetical protein
MHDNRLSFNERYSMKSETNELKIELEAIQYYFEALRSISKASRNKIERPLSRARQH